MNTDYSSSSTNPDRLDSVKSIQSVTVDVLTGAAPAQLGTVDDAVHALGTAILTGQSAPTAPPLSLRQGISVQHLEGPRHELESLLKEPQYQTLSPEQRDTLIEHMETYKKQFDNFEVSQLRDVDAPKLTRKRGAEKIQDIIKRVIGRSTPQQDIGLTASQLMSVTATALVTLQANESMFVKLGDATNPVLATKTHTGELIIGRDVKQLGAGAFGEARLFDIITSSGKEQEAVVKFAVAGREQEALEQIRREVSILNEVHADGILPNVQLPPHTVINVTGEGRQPGRAEGFLGIKYDGDGVDVANSGKLGNKKGAISCMRQAFTGLKALGDKGYVLSDIKPTNIFFKGGVLYLADLPGAQRIMPGDRPKPREVFTPAFTHPDDIASERALKKTVPDPQSNSRWQKLLTAGDVYSTCATCYTMITGKQYAPPEAIETQSPGLSQLNIASLKKCGVPGELIDLLKTGLDADYRLRPTPDDFLRVLNKLS